MDLQELPEVTMGAYTRWSKITKSQLEFFKRHGTDLSYDDKIRGVHVEAYETDDGICIGAITPLKAERLSTTGNQCQRKEYKLS